MASTSTSCSNATPEDTVILECRNLDDESGGTDLREITISTSEIADWNLSAILTHHIIKIKTNRNRLIEYSSYFRALLTGGFSDSSNAYVKVNWSLSTFLDVLRFIYEAEVEISLSNYIPSLQAALYFGVDPLLLECKNWFSDELSSVVLPNIQLDDLVHFWMCGIEYGMEYVSDFCTSYMARNFMWAMECESFVDVQYGMLLSCIKHPCLSVRSERHLAEALLSWIYAHVEEPKYDANNEFHWINILQQIRPDSLPLWFLMGKQNCKYFSKFAIQSTDVILSQLQQHFVVSTDMQRINDFNSWRSRLTQFTENLDLSGCPQIIAASFSTHTGCSFNFFCGIRCVKVSKSRSIYCF